MQFTFGSGHMTNYKVGRQKFGLPVLIMMSIIALGFIAIGTIAAMSTMTKPGWVKVTGEVVGYGIDSSDGKTVYVPTVQYEVGGKSYDVTSNVSTSFEPKTGEKQAIAYNPKRPEEAKVLVGGITKWLLLLFPAMGVLLLIAAVTMFVKSQRRTKNIQHLMQTGQKVQGVLVDIQTQSSSKGNTTYQIVVAAPDKFGAVQNYVSDPLVGVGGLAMADFHNNPIPIDVYLDPQNPKNYYVDISDIPSLTPERISELIKMAASKQAVTPPASTPAVGTNK